MSPEADAIIKVPQLFLLVENPRRGTNLGPLLRCASAFGVDCVVVVGYGQCAVQGSHGAFKHVRLVAFPTALQARDFLSNDCRCRRIIGLLGAYPLAFSTDSYPLRTEPGTGLVRLDGDCDSEDPPRQSVSNRSFPVEFFPFRPESTCFAFGRSAQGLPAMLAECCTAFVHVPHEVLLPPTGATEGGAAKASAEESPPVLLDAASCLSIVLHYWASAARLAEHAFRGHKFAVARSTGSSCRDDDAADARAMAQRLRQRRERDENRRQNEVAKETAIDGGLHLLCMGEGDDET